MDYLLHILILIFLLAGVASSFDLMAGHLGLLSISHIAFFGIGAYASAILTSTYSVSFVPAALFGIGLASFFSFLISVPACRLDRDFFVVASLGIHVVIIGILENWISLTNGALGFPGIAKPVIFGWKIDGVIDYFALSGLALIFTIGVTNRLTRGPYGRVLHAIREDERLAEAFGKRTNRAKVEVFSIAAALAGLSGSIFAHYMGYIDPSVFSLVDALLIVSIVVIGGLGSKMGPVIGSVILVTLPEILRNTGLPSGVAANFRQIILGLVLTILVMRRPNGLFGKETFLHD